MSLAAAERCGHAWTDGPAFLVAHRLGNRLACGEQATTGGRVLVEADLRLHGRRVEVRHARRVRGLPLLCDRWSLTVSRGRTAPLERLLAHDAHADLVLDLKGGRGRLAELVAAAIREGGRAPAAVCARSWALLEPFESLGVRRLASVGSASQLAAFLAAAPTLQVDGVSVHERLLDAASAAALREAAGTVLSWPVNALARGRELVRLGVRGLITDDVQTVAALVAAP